MMLDLEDLLNREADLEKEGAFLPFAVETANRDELLIYEHIFNVKDNTWETSICHYLFFNIT